jgi:hypothetical protein
MKTITKILTLLLIPLLYCFLFSGFNTGTVENAVLNPAIPVATLLTQEENKDFVNAIFNCGIEDVNNRNRWVTGQIDRYRDELKFNSIQIYDYIYGSNNGTDDYGKFPGDLSGTQMTNITDLKDMVYGKDLKLYWERCKISKLCYGQRLVYEISDGGSTSVNNGFCYQYTSGCYETDQGRSVLHLSPGSIPNCPDADATPRFIAENIYENLQHGDLTQFSLQFADAGLWYVKPMMRIPVNTPDDAVVARIDVINFKGNTIKQIVLRGMNFKIGGSYNGQYTENYVFLGLNDSLQISGDTTWGNGGLNDGVNWVPEYQWDNNCHVDFKVYWSGQVEVWFDKMTVDDFYGNMLFNNSIVSDNIINNELSHTASMGFTYFIDEVTNSQIPCIKYVEDKMIAYNQLNGTDAKLHFAGCNYNNWKTMRNDAIGYRIFFDSLEASSFNPDIHEFFSVNIPNVYSGIDSIISDWQVSPSAYNTQLQNHMLGHRNAYTPPSEYIGDPALPSISGSLVYQLALTRQQANTYRNDMKMIVQPQIHSFCSVNSNGKYVAGQREPTTTEILAQAMLSIAHGADGLCWFILN